MDGLLPSQGMTHRAMVTIPAVTAVNEDSITNTFHFQVDPGGVEGALSALDTALIAFYNDATNGVGKHISGFQSRAANACSIKWYRLADAKPRVPVRTTLFTLVAPTGTTPLPRENAIVLSMSAQVVSGLNQKRRRGRVYIGPITTNALTEASGDMRVSASVRTGIAGRASALKAAALAANSPWSIYSTANASPSAVAQGYVDDAIDTQRRRGTRAVARSTWT